MVYDTQFIENVFKKISLNGDFKPPSDNNFPTGFGLGNTSPQSTTPSLSDNVEKDVENLLQRMKNVDEHLQIIHEILQIGQDGRNGTYISQVISHLEERIDHLLSPSAPPAPDRGSPQGGQGNTNTPIPVGGLGLSNKPDEFYTVEQEDEVKIYRYYLQNNGTNYTVYTISPNPNDGIGYVADDGANVDIGASGEKVQGEPVKKPVHRTVSATLKDKNIQAGRRVMNRMNDGFVE